MGKEPKILFDGKRFENRVVGDFILNNQDGIFRNNKAVRLLDKRIGKPDILISGLGDLVAIFEIKNTNWDNIKDKNIINNAWKHQRQLSKYVAPYIEKKISVSLGLIYPIPPKSMTIKDKIETYLKKYGIPVYWFSEIKSK